MMMNAVFSIN